MNKKGFTLIELIITIALLAIIVIISFVSINRVINKSKVNDCNSIAGNIKTAAMEYASDRRYEPGNAFINAAKANGMKYDMTAEELFSNNYLKGSITNPFTQEEITPGSINITIFLNSDYSAKSVSINEPDVLNQCNRG